MCSWKKTAQGRKNSRLLTTAFRTSELDAKLTNDHDQFVDMKAKKKKSSLLWIIHEVKADRVLCDGFYCLMLTVSEPKKISSAFFCKFSIWAVFAEALCRA